MADRITAKFMSHDDWKALGPLNQDLAPEGDNFYDGTTRELPTTPKHASLSVGGPHNTLGNPSHSSRNDAFTNSHAQWFHIAKLYEVESDDTLKFVREAAKAGDKMYAISDRMHGNPDAWVAKASDAPTAGVLRNTITSALTHFPPAKGVLGQELPKKVEDLPIDGLKKDLDTYRPKRFRRRILENGQVRFANPDDREAENDKSFSAGIKDKAKTNPKSKPRQFAGTIAVFADDGLEEVAANYIKDLDDRLLACPEKNGALWKAVSEVRPKGAYYPREYNPSLKQGQAADQLLNRADAVAVFVNGDPTSRVSGILAQASRMGKAVKVIGPDAKEMPLIKSCIEAESAHLTKKEIAQSFSSHAFDVPANEPMAYFGLSQVRHPTAGKIKSKDLSQLASMSETVNEIADMAASQGGREYLRDDLKITPATVRLLGDTDTMASARDQMLKLSGEINRENMSVIGPNDYPIELMKSGDVPPYLIVEGDKDVLRNAETIVGITGSQSGDDRERRIAASAGSKAVSALTMESATVAYVQGQTNVEVPETGPQILISATGAAHVSEKDRAHQKRIIENGGVVIHMQPPETSAWHYDAKAFNKETGKKGAMVPVPSKADPGTQRAAARLLGSMSNTTLVTALNAKEVESHQHVAVKSALRAGRLPTVVNFSEYEAIETVSGNKAMLGSTGEKALSRAGFGNADAEALGPKFEGRKPAIDTGKNMDLAMQNLVRHLKGQEIKVPEKTRDRETRVDAAEL